MAMPAYRALFERAGLASAADVETHGWTSEIIDAVIPWGSGDQVAARVESYFAAGADEVVLSPVGVGSNPESSYESTLEVLSELAQSR